MRNKRALKAKMKRKHKKALDEEELNLVAIRRTIRSLPRTLKRLAVTTRQSVDKAVLDFITVMARRAGNLQNENILKRQ